MWSATAHPSEKREGRPLTLDQIPSTAKAFKPPSDRAPFLTLVRTGLRRGKASALQAGSVDFELNKLTIWRTHSYSGEGGKVIEEVTKNKERRWAPLPETLKRELLPLMKDKDPGADLFAAPQGGVVFEGNWLHRVFRPALKKAGIAEPKGYRIHDRKHTFASPNAKNGISPKELQRVLGHKTLAITTDTYICTCTRTTSAVSGSPLTRRCAHSHRHPRNQNQLPKRQPKILSSAPGVYRWISAEPAEYSIALQSHV